MFSGYEKLKQELLLSKALRLDQIHVAEEEQQKTSEVFDEICIRLGFIESKQIKQVMSKITGIPYVDLVTVDVLPEYSYLLDNDLQRKHSFTVFYKSEVELDGNSMIKVAMVDPADLSVCDFITRQLVNKFGPKTAVEFFYADKFAIEELLESTIRDEDESAHNATSLFEIILKKAISLQASDIHIQPMSHLVQVRVRVDGILRTAHELHRNIWPNLVIRVKILANLDIAESRRPQSGHFDLTFDTQKFDFRVSTHPTIHGENIVIRILHKNKKILSLEQLGIYPQISSNLLEIIKRPYGLILLCGPTGSGKTTTLYSLCSHLDASSLNVMTLEEPVEYQMENVRQTEIQPNGVINFADGVRSILRQDPDIIFIGEIRDEETANIALRAAMTGHLVLSTIHSNDALRAPSRLFDLGIKPELLSGQVVAIMSQRLIRCICKTCEGDGCDACSDTGYKGRTAICELLRVSDEVDACISSQCPIGELAACAHNCGYISMREDGLRKVRDKITTIEELQRALGENFGSMGHANRINSS
ncbi:MAG: type II/IV secretion system protein [Holosporales bacterium]|nr:type II/IV secretion system protein [Holosporales bacterium]